MAELAGGIMQCAAWAAMQRELAASDRIMERAYCAGPVDRLTIGMKLVGMSRSSGHAYVELVFGGVSRCLGRVEAGLLVSWSWVISGTTGKRHAGISPGSRS